MSPNKEITSTTFTPPTVDEVYEYVKDKGLRDPKGFARYYIDEQTERGWTRREGSKMVPVVNWKSNAHQWMIKHMTDIFPKLDKPAEPRIISIEEYCNKHNIKNGF